MLAQAGLAVPPTLVTNDADAVRTFAKTAGELIVKPLAGSVVYESGGEARSGGRCCATSARRSWPSSRQTAHTRHPSPPDLAATPPVRTRHPVPDGPWPTRLTTTSDAGRGDVVLTCRHR